MKMSQCGWLLRLKTEEAQNETNAQPTLGLALPMAPMIIMIIMIGSSCMAGRRATGDARRMRDGAVVLLYYRAPTNHRATVPVVAMYVVLPEGV